MTFENYHPGDIVKVSLDSDCLFHVVKNGVEQRHERCHRLFPGTYFGMVVGKGQRFCSFFGHLTQYDQFYVLIGEQVLCVDEVEHEDIEFIVVRKGKR